jgi:ATP-dependent protease ClpP protease subunit
VIAEVEITGDLARGPYVSPSGARLVPIADVLRQILAARGQASALVLAVNSLGGEMLAGLGVYLALRALSQSGCPVVAHVTVACSTAALYVLGADVVVAGPGAVFSVHGAKEQGATGPDPVLDAIKTASVAILTERTNVPPDTAAVWVDRPYDEVEVVELGSAFGAERALALGFAHTIGELEDARLIASRISRWRAPQATDLQRSGEA